MNNEIEALRKALEEWTASESSIKAQNGGSEAVVELTRRRALWALTVEQIVTPDFVRNLLSTSATAATTQPAEAALTTKFVQTVPDHCDRAVWRNRYIHLDSIAPAVAPEPLTDEQIDEIADGYWLDEDAGVREFARHIAALAASGGKEQ